MTLSSPSKAFVHFLALLLFSSKPFAYADDSPYDRHIRLSNDAPGQAHSNRSAYVAQVEVPLQMYRRDATNQPPFYVGTIYVGQESQEMQVEFDSGSRETWVFGADYQGETTHKYTPPPDACDTTDVFTKKYATSEVKGIWCWEWITIGGLHTATWFGLVTEVEPKDAFGREMNGLIGMNQQRTIKNKPDQPNFLGSFFKAHELRDITAVSFDAVTQGTGKLVLGDYGWNSDQFHDIVWRRDSECLLGEGDWCISWKVQYDGEPALNKVYAILDTGTFYTFLPMPDAQSLFVKTLAVKKVLPKDGFEYYADQCADFERKFPLIRLAFPESKELPVGKNIWEATKDNPLNCWANVRGTDDYPKDFPKWLVGANFFNGFLIIMNREDVNKPYIGIAPPNRADIGDSFFPTVESQIVFQF